MNLVLPNDLVITMKTPMPCKPFSVPPTRNRPGKCQVSAQNSADVQTESLKVNLGAKGVNARDQNTLSRFGTKAMGSKCMATYEILSLFVVFRSRPYSTSGSGSANDSLVKGRTRLLVWKDESLSSDAWLEKACSSSSTSFSLSE